MTTIQPDPILDDLYIIEIYNVPGRPCCGPHGWHGIITPLGEFALLNRREAKTFSTREEAERYAAALPPYLRSESRVTAITRSDI
jgi:hypothetical protein